MKIKVKFYVDFKKLFGEDEIEVDINDGASVQDMLTKLCDTDQRRQAILDGSGKVKPSVMVIVKRGKRSDIVNKERAQLKDGDVVMVLRAVFGG